MDVVLGGLGRIHVDLLGAEAGAEEVETRTVSDN